jgi:predicted acyltransferase
VPVNQGLWTPSFTVLMAGVSTTAFAVCYWILDVRGHTRWSRPFAIYGLNGLTVFVLSQILAVLVVSKGVTTPERGWISLKGYVFERFFLPLGQPIHASLYYSIAWSLAFFALAYVMYRRNWIVKV